MRNALLCAALLCSCAGDPAPTAADVSADVARLVDVSVRSDAAADVAAPLMCARGFAFDTCPQVGELAPCCAVDARTTVPLGCGCLVEPFRCVARGQSGCP